MHENNPQNIVKELVLCGLFSLSSLAVFAAGPKNQLLAIALALNPRSRQGAGSLLQRLRGGAGRELVFTMPPKPSSSYRAKQPASKIVLDSNQAQVPWLNHTVV